jgi:hypothetical protein
VPASRFLPWRGRGCCWWPVPGARTCDSRRHFQDFGRSDPDTHKPGGRNGVEVFKASGDTVQNLTACNSLSGTGTTENGNEIWFNGSEGSGKIGMRGFRGAYLTATSIYFAAQDKRMGLYGIFTSNERGPGIIGHSYASNMGDSAYYFGASVQRPHRATTLARRRCG